MKIFVGKDADELGRAASELAAKKINEAIAKNGEARIVLSTGASQFETLGYLVKEDVDWSRVTMFHLDEYVGLPESHPASFRKYLKERFVSIVHPKAAYFVNGEGDVAANIAKVTGELRSAPIDLALIGIGENAHIAFNDPPADFDTRDAYIVVNLDPRCRKQQVGEGWFKTVDDVPSQAISMTIWQMMQAKSVISSVPGERKAVAIRDTLSAPAVTNMVPATKLFDHADWNLFLDRGSASLTDPKYLK